MSTEETATTSAAVSSSQKRRRNKTAAATPSVGSRRLCLPRVKHQGGRSHFFQASRCRDSPNSQLNFYSKENPPIKAFLLDAGAFNHAWRHKARIIILVISQKYSSKTQTGEAINCKQIISSNSNN
jgi:hypothetical protein